MRLPKYYTSLFNAVSLAITEINDQNYGHARSILVNAQRAAEDFVMDDEAYTDHEFDYLDNKLE